MKLGYILSHERGETDPVLARIVHQLTDHGLRICGTVQINAAPVDGLKCNMDLQLLPDGEVIRISQNRGKLARGCRLDTHSLETAVAEVAARLAFGADLLVINKFGKHEAEGRGFRSVIASALERDIPVLVGLNALNREAFDRFSGGLATGLDADCAAILDWAGLRDAGDRRPALALIGGASA